MAHELKHRACLSKDCVPPDGLGKVRSGRPLCIEDSIFPDLPTATHLATRRHFSRQLKVPPPPAYPTNESPRELMMHSCSALQAVLQTWRTCPTNENPRELMVHSCSAMQDVIEMGRTPASNCSTDGRPRRKGAKQGSPLLSSPNTRGPVQQTTQRALTPTQESKCNVTA